MEFHAHTHAHTHWQHSTISSDPHTRILSSPFANHIWRGINFGRIQEEARNATAYLLRSTCVHADGVDAANAPRNLGVSENFIADKEKAANGVANVSNMNAQDAFVWDIPILFLKKYPVRAPTDCDLDKMDVR
jgi:hypothetical protein